MEKYKLENYDEICELIYTRRIQGKLYKEIHEELNKKGIKISIDKTARMGREIFRELKETDPFGNKKKEIELTKEDETILLLREKGYTFEQIAAEVNSTKQNVNYRYRKLKKFPKNKYSEELKELIFNLREQGFSYQIIEKKLSENGYNLSYGTIEMICQKIYEEKEMEIPSTIPFRTEEFKKIDEIVYALRNKGLSYEKISKELEKMGFSKSRNSVAIRCKRIYKEKEEDEPNTKKSKSKNETQMDNIEDKKLAKMILELVTTKKATFDQVKIMAEYYGVNLEEVMSSIENDEANLDER